jgi:hypothetical protein
MSQYTVLSDAQFTFVAVNCQPCQATLGLSTPEALVCSQYKVHLLVVASYCSSTLQSFVFTSIPMWLYLSRPTLTYICVVFVCLGGIDVSPFDSSKSLVSGIYFRPILNYQILQRVYLQAETSLHGISSCITCGAQVKLTIVASSPSRNDKMRRRIKSSTLTCLSICLSWSYVMIRATQ